MEKFDIKKLWNVLPDIFKKLPSPGVLLVSGTLQQKKNIMTVGWLEFGYVWKEPVVTVLIRPTRFTHQLLREHDEFTINVLSDKYKKEIDFCGSKSGSYCDKFKETGLQASASAEVETPSLKESEIVLECKVIYKTETDPKTLSDIILARYYSGGDYHQMITASVKNLVINASEENIKNE